MNEHQNKKSMRTFIVIWFGQFISTIGSGLTSFAFGVWVYTETGSTTMFAINLLAYTLPTIFFSPILGALVDRWDRRKIMLLNDVGSGITTLLIFLLFTSGNLQIWHIFLSTFFNSLFSSFQWMAYSTVSPMIVPKRHIGRAAGLVQFGDAASMMLAPVAAGALYLSIGLTGIIVLDLVTFCFAVITLAFIRLPRQESVKEEKEEKKNIFKEAGEGWRVVRQNPGLLALVMYFSLIYFTVYMTQVLLEPMLLDLSDPAVMGQILALMGVGGILGTAIMSFWGGPKRRVLGILLTGIVQGIILIGYGVSTSLYVIGISVFLFSLLDPIVSSSSQAFWQIKIPIGLQGRVFAIRRVTSRMAIAVAILVAGPLADGVFEPALMSAGVFAHSIGRWIGVGAGRGTGLLFIILGLLTSLVSLIGLLYSRLRKLDEEIPDALPEND
ncbi:MAG: MFS transporter [Anaerolineaceae bacterium]|nr:MFS transporter [Anaerolineaceae bacterium]